MLNTLKTNLILTRGVLIALFAGLFILAACGGGSKVTPDTSDGGTQGPNPCLTNPYGSTCGSTYEDARQDLFNECRDATASRATVDACDNVPDEAIVCLNDPFDSSCDQEDLANTGGVLLSLQSARVNICRVGNEATDNGQCANALQTRCFATDANPNAFDPLCSKSSVERQTIITKCVDSATLATDADCADARNATSVGVQCFQNPWNADCELLGDFRGTPLATARANRAAYCADTTVDGFDASLCTTAMASVCAASGANANPFSDLCTAANNEYDDVRVAFARNCYTGDRDGANCTVDAPITRVGDEALCGNGDDIAGDSPKDPTCATSVNVETCVNSPFSTTCRPVATFAGARSALLNICTNVVVDSRDTGCSLAGFTADEQACIANPFTDDVPGGINCGTLFTALGGTVEAAQNTLIAVCTSADGADNPNCNAGDMAGVVAICLANPFDTTCDATSLGSQGQLDTAKNNVIALCTTGDALTTNAICIGITGTTKDCISDPFGATCETDLGMSTQTTAQNNLIALCTTADSDNFAMNPLCTDLAAGDVKTCLDNPFTTGGTVDCADVLGDDGNAVMRAQANLNALCFSDSPDAMLCTDNLKTSQFCSDTATGGNPFHANCDDVAGIDAGARTAFCTANAGDDNCTTDLNTLRTTCSANPFADECLVADSGYADNRERAIAACTDVPAGMRANDAACTDVEVKAEVTGENAADAVTLANCVANPFLADCADGVFDTARTASINACAAAGLGDVACTGVEVKAMVAAENGNDAIDAVTLATCFANPFLADCADDIFDGRRTASINACETAGLGDVACTGVEVKAMVAAENGNDAIDAVTLATCFANPYLTACADKSFDVRRSTRVGLCLNAMDRTSVDECDIEIKAEVTGPNAADAVTVEDCIDSPFSADCTDGAFDNARLDSYATCEGVSDTAKATNEDCMRVVVAAVTGENAADAVTVADCVADPFATGCVIDGFKNVRDGICNPSSDSGTVFNTGCTEENYSNIAMTRMEAITFCRGNSYGVGCDTAVSGDADAPTVGACATNPFTAGCDVGDLAELFDIDEQKVTYCAEGASTIFDENCDDARPEVVAERATAVRTCLADGAAIAAYAAGTGTGTDINPVCMRTVLVKGRAEVKAVAEGDVISLGGDNEPGGGDDVLATINDVVEGVTGITEVNLGSCVNDPWLPACANIELLDNARFEHTEVCMRDGLADDTRCMTLIERLEAGTQAQQTRATCIADPFAPACTDAIYGSAKTNRYTFCGSADALFANTADKTLCGLKGDGAAGTTIAGDICSWNGSDSTTMGTGTRINPLATICDVSDNVESRAYYCGVGGRRTADATKGACEADDINTALLGCLANPFNDACTDYTVPATDPTITTELRNFLTMERMKYCTAVDVEGFDETLCQTMADDDDDFASTVCADSGTLANPFAPFCVREGRDDNEFDDVRVTFVQNCKDFAANAVTNAFEGSGACTTEINACIDAPFVEGTGATDCINEPAYASERQEVVDNCVSAFGDGDHATDEDCTTIMGVGQLTCITENPYFYRAEVIENDIVTTAGLDCLGNANYQTVRNALESTLCKADGTAETGTDDRCGLVAVNVCGSGTTAGTNLVIGSNPFNAKFCLDAANIDNYVDQREQLVASCVLDDAAAGCTAEINACITNPFDTAAISSGLDCDDAKVSAAFDDRKVTYCGLEETNNVANADTDGCQDLATTLKDTNACIGDPFADACTDEKLGGEAGAKLAAQSLRTTYCATQGASDDIRQDTGLDAVCRGAANQVCKGDALFDKTTTGYDCFNDKTTYNDARETYATMTCSGNTAARGQAVCTNAIVEICTTTDGLQTNPWADACEGDTTAQRLAVVTECAPLDANARNTNPRCKRTGAAGVYTTCNATSGDPRHADCDDYADGAEPFATARLARYATGCAGANPDGVLCPVVKVQEAICTDRQGANPRPFAPICTSGTPVTGIEGIRLEVLNHCLTNSLNSGICATGDGLAGASITSAATECGSGAAGANPFNPTATITGFTAMVDCEDINKYSGIRTMFQTSCRTALPGTTDYTSTNCAEVVTTICTATTGANANPFSNICNATTHANARATFATSCVGATAPLSNGATCPAAVIECANNPFGSTCVIHGTTNDDPAYNAQKRVVLDACNTGANIIANLNTRCDDAVEDEPCLRDPANCTTGTTVFAPATGDDGGAYLTALLADRLTYCNTDDNINAQKNICRSANSDFAYCTRNPWSNSCEDDLGADPEAFRNTRLAYCRLRSAAELRDPNLNVVVNFVSGTLDNPDNFNLCFAGGTIDDDGHDQHAVGAICAGTSNVTVNMKLNAASADPFTAVCRAFSRYNDERLARVQACAGFDDRSSTGTTVCNWAQQAMLCSNNSVSTTTNKLDEQCGTLNVPTKWASATTTTIEFADSTGAANAFVDNLPNADTAVTFIENTLELHTALPGGRSGGRITDTILPNVRFYTARTAGVDAGAAVTTLGQTLILSSGVQAGGATQDDIDNQVPSTPAVDPGTARFFAGIELGNATVGRPVFNRAANNATWIGTIDWIGAGDAGNVTGARTDAFRLLVNFNAKTVQGAVPVTVGQTTGEHLVIDGSYNAAGYISGRAYINDYGSNPNDTVVPNIGNNAVNTSTDGLLNGLIGSHGAVGVFISNDADAANGFGGGFIVKPPSN